MSKNLCLLLTALKIFLNKKKYLQRICGITIRSKKYGHLFGVKLVWEFNNGLWVREGVLDNTVKGKTAGSIEFAGIGRVVLDLIGDMGGRLCGKKLKFYESGYNETAKLRGNVTAAIALEDYGRWDMDGNVRGALKERRIEGRVYFIKVDDDLVKCMIIEYFNTRSNKKNQGSDNLSVICYVPYEIISH